MVLNESIEKLLQLGSKQKYLKESQIFEELDPEMDVDAIEAVYAAIDNAKIEIIPDSKAELEPKPDPAADWSGGSQDSTWMYLHEIGQYKIPPPEEEKDLTGKVFLGHEAQQMLDESGANMDEETRAELEKTVKAAKRAKDRLTEGNLRLVVSIAKRYTNCGLPLLDLIQEGNLGLMKAIDKFEPDKGYRLTTYASWWIMQAITRSLANMSRLIRVPVHINADIGTVLKVQRQLRAETSNEPSAEDIARRSGFDAEKVQMLLKASAAPISIDIPVNDDEDTIFGDFLVDENAKDPESVTENSDLHDKLVEVMDRILTQRESEVLKLRFGIEDGQTRTLEEVGDIYGVTRERIRQIEGKALRKMHNSRLRRQYVDYTSVAVDDDE